MKKEKAIENAVISFGEWLQEKDVSYAMFVVMGDRTRYMLSGETEDVISSLATAIIQDEQTRQIVMESLNLAAEVLRGEGINLN